MLLGIIASMGLTSLSSINWTVLLSIISVCVAGSVSLIDIFGRRVRQKDFQRLENENEEMKKKHEALKDNVGQMELEIATFKEKVRNSEKTTDEMKQDIKDVVQKLDELLKRFMDFLS